MRSLPLALHLSHSVLTAHTYAHVDPLFVSRYDQVDKEAVPYGPDNDRWSVKGSPVVPGSLQKRAEDMETNLYTVIVLRRFVEGFKSAVREDMRGVVRDFVYEPEAKDRALDEAAELERDYDVILMKLFRWCDVHFGEAIMVWIHVKVSRMVLLCFFSFSAYFGRDRKGSSVFYGVAHPALLSLCRCFAFSWNPCSVMVCPWISPLLLADRRRARAMQSSLASQRPTRTWTEEVVEFWRAQQRREDQAVVEA